MVLIRALVALLLVAGAGCGESLFDAHGARGDAGDDTVVPTTCPADCLADAAADFNGSAGGTNGFWHYFDDRRNKTWMEMTASAGIMDGFEQDQITSCVGLSAAACKGLPGALLVTSSGGATSDPAIEYRSPATRVIQLSFSAHVPSAGAAQRIRLYRNSREDALLTSIVAPGQTAGDMIVVDALEGDRFLIAVEPTGAGGDLALHFFVSDPRVDFPSTCRLALAFESASDDKVDNLCRDPSRSFPNLSFLQYNVSAPISTPVSLLPPSGGPFVEQGSFADIVTGRYFKADDLDLLPPGALTVQLWARHDTLGLARQYVFSTLDKNVGGGLAISIFDASGGKILVTSSTKATQEDVGEFVPYPFSPGGWHFIRVVGANDKVDVCLDGKWLVNFGYPTADLVSTYPVHLGRNVVWGPDGAFLDGGIDDVRVFSGALPCEPTN